MHCISRQT